MTKKYEKQKTREKGGVNKKMNETKEMKKIEQKNFNKGITLIALVITIIVLLILAGVSIVTLTGQGNIFERAAEAKEKNAYESLKESINVVMAARKISKATGQEVKSLREDLETIEGAEVEEVKEDTCYVTRDGYTVTVYEDGDIEIGKISVWDGETSEAPEIKDFNWYIYNGAQMKFFADFVNNANALTEEQKTLVQEKGYNETDIKITADTIVYLMEDIDLGARQNNGELTSGEKWEPIGTTSEKQFIGTFDGNNYMIKGLYINRTENFAGFFGRSTNTIKNVTLKNGYVKGGNCMGGLVGLGNVVENCHNVNTTVTSMEGNYCTIGGLAGQVNSNIKDCTNSGTIIANGRKSSNGHTYCGGVAGGLVGVDSVENCTNIGSIFASGMWVGGVIGSSSLNDGSVNIKNCTNMGNVTGTSSVGGIVGSTPHGSASTIEKCSNSGEITGTDDVRYCGVAGIVGLVSNSATCSISNTYNTGKIIGKGECIGGLFGQFVGEINNCYNIGDVEGKSHVGGISGLFKGTITKSYNSGRIKGIEYLGGICGANFTASGEKHIKNCYNIGKIVQQEDGKSYIGGIIGNSNYANATKLTISNNYNIGEIEINGKNVTNVGGVIGDNKIEEDATRIIKNNYYKEEIYHTEDNKEGESKTAEEMKGETEEGEKSIVDLLNEGLDEQAWEIRPNENDGYPVLIIKSE